MEGCLSGKGCNWLDRDRDLPRAVVPHVIIWLLSNPFSQNVKVKMNINVTLKKMSKVY